MLCFGVVNRKFLPTNSSVVVVEDDPRLRDLIVDELAYLGVNPFICSNGVDLIELLKSTSVDLILLDLMMPVMDGFACLHELRVRHCEVPVVVVTAHADSSYRKRVIEAGASDFVLKPDLFELLPSLLNQYLKGPPITG